MMVLHEKGIIMLTEGYYYVYYKVSVTPHFLFLGVKQNMLSNYSYIITWPMIIMVPINLHVTLNLVLLILFCKLKISIIYVKFYMVLNT